MLAHAVIDRHPSVISSLSVLQATFDALRNTYGFLSPDLWRETKYTKAPLQVRVMQAGSVLGAPTGADPMYVL